MSNGYFVVQNGLQVGPLTIDATTGSITTAGDVSITGNLGVSQISKNDSSVAINDIGGSSTIVMKIDNNIIQTIDANGMNLASGDSYAINGTNVLSSTTLGSGVVNSSLTSVGTLTGLTVSGITRANGNLVAASGIASTNTTTGALVVTGGTGIAGALNVGGATNITGATTITGITKANGNLVAASGTASTNTTTGALVVTGGAGISGALNVGGASTITGVGTVTGNLVAASTTNSTSSTTGALVVRGGLGVANNVNIGAGNLTISTDNTATAFVTSATLTNPLSVATKSVNDFIQIAISNRSNGTSASSDFIAYSNTGTDTQGYINMGIASSAFNDPAYGVTKAGDGYVFLSAPAGTGGNLVLATADGTWGDVVFAAGGFSDGKEQGRFKTNDGLYLTGNLVAEQGTIYQGEGAKLLEIDGAASGFGANYVGLTNASGIFVGNENAFVQFALKNHNTGSSASTDVIAYASNGDNDSGWIDMGITSGNFSDATYGVTGPNDGYIFMSAPAGTTGNGDLFLSTSDNGDQNDIVFSTNGFAAGSERMRIVGNSRPGKPAGVEIYIPTTSTSTSTGALRVQGGVGIQGNLFVGGNFNLVGNISIGGAGSTTSTSTLVIENPISFLANANNGDVQDIGIVGQYTNGGTRYAGVVRDSAHKSFRFFDGLTTKPSTTVNWAGTVAGNVYMGTAMVANATASTTTTTGAFQVVGGAGIGGQLNVGGATNKFTATTASTSTTTGALVVSGGVGIAGATYLGSTLSVTGIITATSAVSNFGTVNTTTLEADNFSSANIRVSGGYLTGLANVGATTGSFTNVGGTLTTAAQPNITSVGTLTGLTVSGAIVPSANLTVNIGSTSAWFNTFYGISTQAKYADLAENYLADSPYEPGTVVEFGGENEVTIATDSTKRVAGVVSTNPAHLMNGQLTGRNVVALALQGRVPCKVIGPVQKGDLMISAGFGYAKANNDAATGQVIGKALADFTGAKGVIEVVVGRV